MIHRQGMMEHVIMNALIQHGASLHVDVILHQDGNFLQEHVAIFAFIVGVHACLAPHHGGRSGANKRSEGDCVASCAHTSELGFHTGANLCALVSRRGVIVDGSPTERYVQQLVCMRVRWMYPSCSRKCSKTYHAVHILGDVVILVSFSSHSRLIIYTIHTLLT
jgi:hypothetical protein